jgi:hypothetical protein
MNNQAVGNYDEDSIPPEIVAAYREAEARGLPSGWTCSIDVRHFCFIDFACMFFKKSLLQRIPDILSQQHLY